WTGGTRHAARPARRLLDRAREPQGLRIRRLDVTRAASRGKPLPAFASEVNIAMPASGAADALVAAGGVATEHGHHSIVCFADPVAAARAAMDIAVGQDIPVGAHYAAFNP